MASDSVFNLRAGICFYGDGGVRKWACISVVALICGCSVFVVASELSSINGWLIGVVHFLGFTSNISYVFRCTRGSIVCCSWFARSVTVIFCLYLLSVTMVGWLFDI